jgi:hypothetical protein
VILCRRGLGCASVKKQRLIEVTNSAGVATRGGDCGASTCAPAAALSSAAAASPEFAIAAGAGSPDSGGVSAGVVTQPFSRQILSIRSASGLYIVGCKPPTPCANGITSALKSRPPCTLLLPSSRSPYPPRSAATILQSAPVSASCLVPFQAPFIPVSLTATGTKGDGHSTQAC